MAKLKTMTVARLHKQLCELMEKGCGRMKVCVSRDGHHH